MQTPEQKKMIDEALELHEVHKFPGNFYYFLIGIFSLNKKLVLSAYIYIRVANGRLDLDFRFSVFIYQHF